MFISAILLVLLAVGACLTALRRSDILPSLAPTATPAVVRGGSGTPAPNASDEHAGLQSSSCGKPDTSTLGTHTQTVPLKFRVVDANGPVTDLTGVTVSGRTQSCAEAWAGACRSVGVDIGDGLNHTADFRFT